MKIKIYGAGSIGNHLANASRALGYAVDLCDIDPAALERTRSQIYPARYGKWDDAIRLFPAAEAPRGGYDLIIVGTPPDHHIPLALAAIAEQPRAVLVEKPLCRPNLAGAQPLHDAAQSAGVPVFVGYDHVVGAAARRIGEIFARGEIGAVETIDVEFREHWGGIFNAHPWLSGPADSYLGYWERGGGAGGEHSHALNLWQHFAGVVGAGRVVEVDAAIEYFRDGGLDYDKICALHLRTESGLLGRVVQDVVTAPPRKWGRIQGATGYLEWHCGIKPGHDAVFASHSGAPASEEFIAKTRPQDFINELEHITRALQNPDEPSPLRLEQALDTMLVLAAAHRSAREGRRVRIDYAQGCALNALHTS